MIMDLESQFLDEGVLPLPEVMVSRRKASSSKSGIWWVAVALCAAAAVCFTLYKSQNNQEGGNEQRLTLRDHLSKENVPSKVAIHLSGAYDPDVSKDNLDWKFGFVSGGLKLVDREIIIPNDGIYFVYSQVSFHISCKNDIPEDHKVVHMSHAVFHYSESFGSYKPLLSAIRSVSVHASNPEDMLYNTIYLGAAFNLQAGDKLHTKTTTELLPNVENDITKTLFGVFAL
ncbi:tumor necrosis factor-like [Sinocyclocheilus grahami]|uniref:Tumor necrosis factor-like n=1 Tax=Sinocyclocheilus grahami TaxID=75366 RepID=A0A672QLX9_SINGR|nr:PREDICTED: tumor necrosis factor-like [Sinocyclocheilus grahami]XP_016144004.1 PREDICTED: tumor necrosis factor-like [Sinocyclocheilus grahami]